jgi:predicted dehydrogenase
MTDQPIRLGFVGAGNIFQQRHLPNLRQIDGVEFKAIANRSPQSSQRVADQWDIPETEAHWESLVAREDIDAVLIGTWPYLHREVTVAALNAGKHVFCQARMCMDWSESEAMVAAARSRPDLVTMICPPPHRMPWEPFIRNRIENDDLGEIREVRLASLNAANADPDKLTWREQVEYSGLQILQAGIWAETLNAWLGEYRWLQAALATPLDLKTDEDGQTYPVRIPQIVMVTGELDIGAAACEHHSGLSLHESANFVSIHGAKATLRVDAMQSIRFAEAGDDLQPVEVPEDEQRRWRVERDFIEAVRNTGRGEPWSVDPDFTAGQRYMRKVQAIHDAARQGRAVHLADSYPLTDTTPQTEG